MKTKLLAATALGAVAVAAATTFWLRPTLFTGHTATDNPPAPASASGPGAASTPGAALDAAQALHGLKQLLATHRQIVVLLADEQKLSATEREAANRVGHALFHEGLRHNAALLDTLSAHASSTHPQRHAALGGLLDYVEADPDLFDADRLAFRELLLGLQAAVARDGTLPGIKLHKRLGEDLEALAEIERNYDKELKQIFSRFETRAIELKRERWDDYLAHLRQRYNREQILKDQGVVLPYPAAKAEPPREKDELFGDALPPKTLVLTFDDGPHSRFTPEVAAILQQYGVPAIFFEVGTNLGTVDAQGQAQLQPARADISRQLLAQGHALANHSYTHAQLSKRSGEALKEEVLNTDALLKAVDPKRSVLFRFPYGARNDEGLQLLKLAQLRSVMWNIDSLDWADPVPSSIADRVLREVNRAGRGIVLFHDIHERTTKALPLVLDRLVAEGYQFAGWDGNGFALAKTPGTPAAPATPTPATAATAGGYADSWALVVGIDDYAKWPKLQHAVRDARAVRDALVRKFGFDAQHVVMLENQQATRTGILGAFHDKLAHSGMKKNDRLFVFFAGHGATRQLQSGRDLGYIVPVDAAPDQLATDAIPMTELQNIAESVTAKHALFVMDACYSGLGLTRGGTSANFLRDNARRVGRQMLTAGGADQLVADSGPGGHSVFTWTLLQGLGGKADLNGDGLITATELAAYVAPAVSAVSQQTPAFGSLPGSQGGDFIFELPSDTEFLSADTGQLPAEAIALNGKLDAVSNTPAPTPVAVKDLQGGTQKLVLPAAVPTTQRQLAQRANDRGLQLYREKRYAEAEAQFTEALKQQPGFALAANNLGFVYYKQDKYPEAARWFQNAIGMDPSRAVAYLNLGDAHAKAGDAAQAKKAFQTYLELAPNGAGAAHAREVMAGL